MLLGNTEMDHVLEDQNTLSYSKSSLFRPMEGSELAVAAILMQKKKN